MGKSLGILLGFIILPAFGAVTPFRSDDAIVRASAAVSGTKSESDASVSGRSAINPVRQPVVQRTTSSERGAARVVSAESGVSSRQSYTSGGGRVVAARGATANNVVMPRTTTARTTSGAFVAPRTVGIDNSDTTNSRIGIRGTVASRVPAIRISSSGAVTKTLAPAESTTAETTANTLAEMDSLAEMTDYCKSQYASCMDNYCNVLDDNQGRCSCSANLKNYAKAESALKTATEELQDVAQKIQYIGLTSREVETLFSETEAELKMSTTTDNSQIKTSLDKIKTMLVEVRTGTASSDSTSSSFGFDLNGLLDFTIDSTGFDLSSFLGGFNGNTSSVNNQRGEELYKTAVNRCKSAVLKSCTAQGVDANLITNSYDLQIDKECILYERSLTDSNDQMVATIRNAKNVLQKARLLVAQQKNAYDMRGCINALDSCMQDEFVCGTDYENCLDPTGRYIVNGSIVLGSQPGHAIDPTDTTTDSPMTSDVCAVNLYRTWDMPGETCQSTTTAGGTNNNAWGVGTGDTLMNYIEQSVTSNAAATPSTNLAMFLQNKIGYVTDTRNYGMCISVLNKCQDYTYTGSGTNAKYNPQNDVIKQYLARALVQIKARQDQVLSDYADSCVSDVTSCLSQNNYPSNASSATNSTAANIAINACRATIVTCMSVNGYSIGTPTPTQMVNWVFGLSFPDPQYTITYNCGDGSPQNNANLTQTVQYDAYFTTRPGTICNVPVGKSFDKWSVSVNTTDSGDDTRASQNTGTSGSGSTETSQSFLGNTQYKYSYKTNITLTAQYKETTQSGSGSQEPTNVSGQD